MKKFPKTPKGFSRIEILDDEGEIKRVTFNPHKQTRDMERKFLKAFGEVPYFSIASSIAPHMYVGNVHFVKMDIKDAFGSLRIKKVREVLKNRVKGLNDREDIFFHPHGGVIQGSLSAPKIFEGFCSKTIDVELSEYCSKRGIVFTRYVDDILFSSNRPIPKVVRRVFRKILRKHGMEPNVLKDEVLSTWKRPLEVLGLEIYRKRARVTEEFKGILSELRQYDWYYENQIKGREAWINYVDSMNK